MALIWSSDISNWNNQIVASQKKRRKKKGIFQVIQLHFIWIPFLSLKYKHIHKQGSIILVVFSTLSYGRMCVDQLLTLGVTWKRHQRENIQPWMVGNHNLWKYERQHCGPMIINERTLGWKIVSWKNQIDFEKSNT